MTFRTMQLLPDLGTRRYGLVELGGDASATVRKEHAQLLAVAAAVLGLDSEQVTVELVSSIDLSALRDREALARQTSR